MKKQTPAAFRLATAAVAAAGALTLAANPAAASVWITRSPSPSYWNNPDNWDGGDPWVEGNIADCSQTDITVDMRIEMWPHSRTIGAMMLGDTAGNQKYQIAFVNGKTLTFNELGRNATLRFGGTETNGEHRLDTSTEVILADDLDIIGNATNAGVGAHLVLGRMSGVGAPIRVITYTGRINWVERNDNGGDPRPFVSFVTTNPAFASQLIANNGVFNSGNSAAADFGAVPGNFMADFLTLDGGAVRSGGPDGTTLTFEANRGITLGASGGVLWPGGARKPITVNSVISGPGKLCSIGVPGNQGVNTLNADNTYAGETVVRYSTLIIGSAGSILQSPTITVHSNATLKLQQNHALTDSATVRLFSDAGSNHGKADLAFTGVQRVHALYLDGDFAYGSWGSTASPAANKSDIWFAAGSPGVLLGPESGLVILVR